MAAETSDPQTPSTPSTRKRLRGAAGLAGRVLTSWPALWIAFAVVHVVLIKQSWEWEGEIYGDVTLYEWWARNGLDSGWWVVFDTQWVYPVGALVPVTLPALIAGTTYGYEVVWSTLVTMLDALALLALGSTRPRGRVAAWFWLAFLLALGPIFIGRLDGVIAPIILVALLVAVRHPVVAMVLATAGAWIKIAPGAVAVALFAAARRPVRHVLLPGAAVTAVVLIWALAGGAGSRVFDVFGEQGDRGLQVESVAATPFLVSRLWGAAVTVDFNDRIFTYEILGDAARRVAGALDYALPIAVLLIAVLAWWAGRRRPDLAGDILLLTAAAELVALIVFNKVGSPQFLAWVGPPVAAGIALASAGRRHTWAWTWLPPAVGAIVAARLTQEIFPRQYGEFLGAWPHMVWVGAARNTLLVLLLVGAVVRLVQVAVGASPYEQVRATAGAEADDTASDADDAPAGADDGAEPAEVSGDADPADAASAPADSSATN